MGDAKQQAKYCKPQKPICGLKNTYETTFKFSFVL